MSLKLFLYWADSHLACVMLPAYALLAGVLFWAFGSKTLMPEMGFSRSEDCMLDASPMSTSSFVVFTPWTFRTMPMYLAIVPAQVLNFFIVKYHLTNPPHPKFMMLPVRWFGVRLHVASGVTEIVLSFICWFIPNEPGGLLASQGPFSAQNFPYVRLMALAAISHCVSAMLMTPSVFGQPLLSIPAYMYVSTFKLVQAVNVLLNPDCSKRVLCLICLHTTYAWFRLFYHLMEGMGIMPEYAYTLALVFSGSLISSVVVRFCWLLCMFFVMAFAVVLYCIAPLRARIGRIECPRVFSMTNVACPFGRHPTRAEHHLAAHKSKVLDQFKLDGADVDVSDSVKARFIFDAIDVDKNGQLDRSELMWALAHCGMTAAGVDLVLQRFDDNHDGKIDFSEWEAHFHSFYVWAYKDLLDNHGKSRRELKEEYLASDDAKQYFTGGVARETETESDLTETLLQ